MFKHLEFFFKARGIKQHQQKQKHKQVDGKKVSSQATTFIKLSDQNVKDFKLHFAKTKKSFPAVATEIVEKNKGLVKETQKREEDIDKLGQQISKLEKLKVRTKKIISKHTENRRKPGMTDEDLKDIADGDEESDSRHGGEGKVRAFDDVPAPRKRRKQRPEDIPFTPVEDEPKYGGDEAVDDDEDLQRQIRNNLEEERDQDPLDSDSAAGADNTPVYGDRFDDELSKSHNAGDGRRKTEESGTEHSDGDPLEDDLEADDFDDRRILEGREDLNRFR